MLRRVYDSAKKSVLRRVYDSVKKSYDSVKKSLWQC